MLGYAELHLNKPFCVPAQKETLLHKGRASVRESFYSKLRLLVMNETPSPLNLWMNIPVAADGQTSWGEPVSKAGDHVILRAEMDCIAAMSCCPQDILPVNAGSTVECHFEILD